ncbi:MAG: NAD(P)H-hydrate dehydratase [Chthoniobacterales bacterium]
MESPILTSGEMRAAEEAAFARGVTAEVLMDEAAAGIARAVFSFFPTPARCIVFVGKGNNGGDAITAAGLLRSAGWAIELRLVFPEHELGELPRRKLREYGKAATILSETVAASRPPRHCVVLDGLLGLGAKPPLREPIRSACREINQLRREQNAFVFAIDIPSGLDGDSGEADADCVIADFTLTIGFAKRGLVADRAINYVGRLEIIALQELHANGATVQETVAEACSLRRLLTRRGFNAYKTQFGRVGVLAGSKGLTGAAVLCSSGALRAGAGLVELFVREDVYAILASSVPPEVMVKPLPSYTELPDGAIEVWAIGPGLDHAEAAEILRLIEKTPQPMVIDADGLNILSEKMPVLQRCAGPRLLTPHPGEMKRLFPTDGLSRLEVAKKFCAKYPVTLLLKGSRTIVAEQGRPCSHNATGNPGMATGGMGDVLTGVCAALVAQKLSLYDAARLGAWLCGRAAELAVFNGRASEESLLPSDVLDHLGAAFNDLLQPSRL